MTALSACYTSFAKCILCLLQVPARELAIALTWHGVVTETMNRVLGQDDSDLQWQPDDCDLPIYSTVCGCNDFALIVLTIQHHALRLVDPLSPAGWMQDAQRLARRQVKSAHAVFDEQQCPGVRLHRPDSTEGTPLAFIGHQRR